MKARNYIIAALIGLMLGYACGFISTNVRHYNEFNFGSSYSSFQLEWLGFPGLPGLLITQQIEDYDWGIDEAWFFRHQIRLWNALFWSGIAAISVPILSVLTSPLASSGHAKAMSS